MNIRAMMVSHNTSPPKSTGVLSRPQASARGTADGDEKVPPKPFVLKLQLIIFTLN